MIKIGVIVSTTRPGRRGKYIAEWLLHKIDELNLVKVQFDLIDLKEENLPFLCEPKSPADADYKLDSTKKWSKKIASYDGFIFVTAEYNNGPPAPLKNAIDSIYKEWDKKPLVFLGYGTYGATRAVEQLVEITAKIGMVPLSKTFVGIPKVWENVTEDGAVNEESVMGSIPNMIENLLWWVNTIKAAQK